ncbi:hypothetical protein SELMODRAFT_418257 [Selaginella moellendorffii]|uniref:Uncharacterized protein n=1 Tax=Selaginella moellendorffii TaxID=88036 RepID=D8S557_SELML|nr:hypothetical protein SELMODRAFT_418257 [Selaginella moellendorffii]
MLSSWILASIRAELDPELEHKELECKELEPLPPQLLELDCSPNSLLQQPMRKEAEEDDGGDEEEAMMMRKGGGCLCRKERLQRRCKLPACSKTRRLAGLTLTTFVTTPVKLNLKVFLVEYFNIMDEFLVKQASTSPMFLANLDAPEEEAHKEDPADGVDPPGDARL